MIQIGMQHEKFSLGNAINKPRLWSHAIVRVNAKPIL